MIEHVCFFEALVGATEAERRKMRKVHVKSLAKLRLKNPQMERINNHLYYLLRSLMNVDRLINTFHN